MPAPSVATRDVGVDVRDLVGSPVFIRTVTHYYVGRLVELTPTDLVLTEASWVPDSGRWSQSLRTGELSEVEPYPPEDRVYVSQSIRVDVVRWHHPLPAELK